MNNLAHNSKRKNINYLMDNLLGFERNTKHLKNVVEWSFNDESLLNGYVQSDDWNVEKECFYINENHQVAIRKTAIKYGKTIFVLQLTKMMNNTNDFYRVIPENNQSNYVLISLDKFLYDYKLLVLVKDSDIQFLGDIKLRKLNYCIECNQCSEVCPVNIVQPNFHPLEFITKEIVENGYVKNQLCMSCGKCDTVCPVGINISDYFLYYNKPKKWNENILNKVLNNNTLSKYAFKFIKS